MTDQPTTQWVEVVSLVAEPRHVVVPKSKQRQWVDAPEPGTHLDPFTGRLKRTRPGRRWWAGSHR